MRFKTYEVTSDEVFVIEVTVGPAREDTEVLGQSNETTEEQRNDRPPETEGSGVGQLIVGDTLGTTCTDEPDVRNEQRNPRQQTKDSGEIDEVAENDLGVIGGVHESGAADERRYGQSRNGNTTLVGPPEDLRCVTLLSQTIDSTRSDVQIRVRGTEGEDQDAGIEDVRQMSDAGNFDGDNKG